MTNKGKSPDLQLSTAPFLHAGSTTPRIMLEVSATLLPLLAAACWFFGIGSLLVVTAAAVGALTTESILSPSFRLRPLSDGSALLTGLLLGLTLPPAFPLWMAFLGGVAAIGLGKWIWGGLGQNIFNPALVGRAFLQAAFPTAITTWSPLRAGEDLLQISPRLFAFPLMQGPVDAVSTATPLGLAKFAGQPTALQPLLFGNVSGSIGETSGILLIICGAWLGLRHLFDWRLPVSTVVSVAGFSAVLYWWNSDRFPDPFFMVLSGGLLFAAVFMVTDPVTTPTTTHGAWVFGVGTGFLVVLIRVFGGLPEGVMYAILLMNAVTPYVNHYTQPRRFGG